MFLVHTNSNIFKMTDIIKERPTEDIKLVLKRLSRSLCIPAKACAVLLLRDLIVLRSWSLMFVSLGTNLNLVLRPCSYGEHYDMN